MEVYFAFIEGELKAERERRAALEARGVSVVTQSGALVTLLTGVGAVVHGASSSALPTLAVRALVAALVFFFLAALGGILVNFWPLYPGQNVADNATMTQMRTTKRRDTDEVARSTVAHLYIGTLMNVRKGNNRKLEFVAAAQFFQILALVAVSIAVYFVITHN